MGELRKLIEALFEVEAAGNVDVALQLYAEDVEFKGPLIEQHGRDAMRGLIESTQRAFPDMRREILSSVEEGDAIAFEVRARATQTGLLGTTGGDIPPTGRSIDTVSGVFARIENGLVRSWHTYYDGRILMQQLGLMPG